MKINRPTGPAAAQRISETRTAATAGKGARTSDAKPSVDPRETVSGEFVQVSKAARQLARNEFAPAFDLERVERLRAEIAAGTFKIDPGSIADAMLREER